MVINIDPILFQIGPLAIRWYGLMYAVGITCGVLVMMPYARERGFSEDDIWGLVWPCVIAGLLGARLYYVAQSNPLSYLGAPWRIIATWEGGMAYYGAIFGVVPTLVILGWRKGLPIRALLDVASIFAVVGQGIGRIGNIVNGDVIGYPTTLPWGIAYTHPRAFVPELGVPYHPAAIYSLLFNALLFAFLWRFRARFRPSGMLCVSYLVLYSIGQFVIFFWRMNEVVAFGLKQAQLTALVVLIACVPLAWWLRRQTDRGSDVLEDNSL